MSRNAPMSSPIFQRAAALSSPPPAVLLRSMNSPNTSEKDSLMAPDCAK
jgi:hypothetical protein